ncbi:MAG: hypothetical protein ACETWG_11550 [Candidatus Neomarinimicrobiota bacterium]
MKSKIVFSIVSSLCILFFYPSVSNAQSISNQNGPVRRFSKGLIIKNDRSRFNGTDLVFTAQTLSFINQLTSENITFPLTEIQYVKAKVGNHAIEGALFGGALFLLSAISAVLQVEADPFTEVENGGQVIAIITGIGLGGGFVIGAIFPKEKIVFNKGKFLVNKNPFQNNISLNTN